MATPTTSGIYLQLKDVIDRGNEQDIRDFLTANIDKFSPSVRAEITGAFFGEQLENIEGGVSLVKDFQEQGMNMAHEMEGDRHAIEDAVKVKDIQEKLAE